jgi:choline dehydrogenase-like flavoprotein
VLLDLDQITNGEKLTARVAIVGAGAIGLALAVTLARNGIDVIVLESGGRRFEGAVQALNTAEVIGRKHLGISNGRARILGGTSTLWGGQLIAFNAIDFETREWLGCSAWPLDLAELIPYYDRAADLLDLNIKQGEEMRIWRTLKIDPPNLGADLEIVLTRWLRETNLATYFAKDLKARANLRVLLHATAVNFSCDSQRVRISEILARSLSGRTAKVVTDAVVLACGTIEASRLLLASVQKNNALPWAQNIFVGRYFQDHLDVRAARVKPIDKKAFSNAFDNIYLNGYKYNPKIHLRERTQKEEKLLNIAAGFLFDSSLSAHLSNLKLFIRAFMRGAVPPNFKSIPSHIVALAKLWWPLVSRYLIEHRAFNPGDLGIYLGLSCEQEPIWESAVKLDDRRVDAHGVPQVKLDWHVGGREIETMATFSKKLQTRLAESGIAQLEIDSRLEALDISILDACYDTYHQCGGLRIAESAKQGVVDRDLCIFGTSNMYVAGCAVFPSSSFANPTFTAIALTLRLADHLATKFNHG